MVENFKTLIADQLCENHELPPSNQQHPANTAVRYGKCYVAIDNKGIHTAVYIILPSTHMPKDPSKRDLFSPILKL
jgi:hypothetical protein